MACYKSLIGLEWQLRGWESHDSMQAISGAQVVNVGINA